MADRPAYPWAAHDAAANRPEDPVISDKWDNGFKIDQCFTFHAVICCPLYVRMDESLDLTECKAAKPASEKFLLCVASVFALAQSRRKRLPVVWIDVKGTGANNRLI